MNLNRRHFDEAAHLVCTRQITFDEFARRTSKDIDSITAHFRTWPLPSWVGQEDVRQEVLRQAWHWSRKWKASRGQPAGRFLMMQVLWRTRRSLLKTMGVSTHRAADSGGKIWSDIEVSLRTRSESREADPIQVFKDPQPTAEERMSAHEERSARYDYLREQCAATSAEVIALTAMEKYGDVLASARAIARSTELSAECGGIEGTDQAKRVIERTLNRLVQEYGQVA